LLEVVSTFLFFICNWECWKRYV